jgi:hypothetical protein
MNLLKLGCVAQHETLANIFYDLELMYINAVHMNGFFVWSVTLSHQTNDLIRDQHNRIHSAAYFLAYVMMPNNVLLFYQSAHAFLLM